MRTPSTKYLYGFTSTFGVSTKPDAAAVNREIDVEAKAAREDHAASQFRSSRRRNMLADQRRERTFIDQRYAQPKPAPRCHFCNEPLGDARCYSVGGSLAFCDDSCRSAWERSVEND